MKMTNNRGRQTIPLAHTQHTDQLDAVASLRLIGPIDRAMYEQILRFLRHPTWSLNERMMAPNQCLDHRFDDGT